MPTKKTRPKKGKPYCSVLGARHEAVKRFEEDNWQRLVDVRDDFGNEVYADEWARGRDHVAQARTHLERAIVELGKARRCASVALDLLDPRWGPWGTPEVSILPRDVGKVLERTRAIHKSLDAVAQQRSPGKAVGFDDRVAFIRMALAAGVKAPATEPAAAFAYALIALQVESPLGSDRWEGDEERKAKVRVRRAAKRGEDDRAAARTFNEAWKVRLRDFGTALRRARALGTPRP